MRLLCIVTTLLVGIDASAAARKRASGAERAFSLVVKARFTEAIPLLQEALGDGNADPVEVHLALAKCYFYTAKNDRATLELEVAFEAQAGLTIDAREHAPDFVTFFDNTKKRLFPVAPSASPPLAPAAKPTVALTPPPVEYQSAPAYLRWLPLGVGQFLNGDPVGGALILSLGAAFIGANIAFTVLNMRARAATGDFPAGQQWPIFYGAQQASAAAAIITAVIGVVDAFLWSPGRGRARFSASVAVTPVAAGASMGVEF